MSRVDFSEQVGKYMRDGSGRLLYVIGYCEGPSIQYEYVDGSRRHSVGINGLIAEAMTPLSDEANDIAQELMKLNEIQKKNKPKKEDPY